MACRHPAKGQVEKKRKKMKANQVRGRRRVWINILIFWYGELK